MAHLVLRKTLQQKAFQTHPIEVCHELGQCQDGFVFLIQPQLIVLFRKLRFFQFTWPKETTYYEVKMKKLVVKYSIILYRIKFRLVDKKQLIYN